jgi:hypothetical protein
MTSVQTPQTSRAVTRNIEAGNSAICAVCGHPVKFSAKTKLQQVIANVYVDHVWVRVEHYHAECYDEAGQPYGSAT